MAIYLAVMFAFRSCILIVAIAAFKGFLQLQKDKLAWLVRCLILVLLHLFVATDAQM